MKYLLILFVLILISSGCVGMVDKASRVQEEAPDLDNATVATFAGGCFWCMEAAFEAVDGVKEVISGYAGGEEENPSYQEVAGGNTGHLEAVRVYYDPDIVTYEELVFIFWRQINPTDDGGQFADRGEQYRTAIFYSNQEEKEIAEKSKADLDASGKFDGPVVTMIMPFKNFYKAEEYHQDYYKKNVARYYLYEQGSGRAGYREDTWK